MTADLVRLHPELRYRQRRILEYVTLVVTRDDRSPSLREIADACDVSSTSVVDYNIDRLVERGLLIRSGAFGEQRRVTLPVNPWRQLVEDADVIFDKLAGINDFIDLHIAGWRERRAKLIHG